MSSLIIEMALVGSLLFAAASLVSAQNIKPLDAFFDPGANETTVYLSQKYLPLTLYPQEGFMPPDTGEYISKPEGLVLTVFFKTPGNVPKVPTAVTLNFESRSSGDFRYKNDRKLMIKADAEMFDLGQLSVVKSELDRSSRGMRGAYYEETLEGSIRVEDYSRIVNAKRVQMTIGKTKFRLADQRLKELRSYIEKLKS
jgi:hypothetical protein